MLRKDTAAAKSSLTHSEQIRRTQTFWPAWYAGSTLLAQFMLDLQLLEDAIGSNSRELIPVTAKAALKSGRKAVKNSAAFAAYRAENYRWMGVYYWLVGKQRKALKWFDRSLEEGRRLGARPDLARTYMEVGKRLMQPDSRYRELNGIIATEYLDDAEELFRVMDLRWDLEQLHWVRTGR